MPLTEFENYIIPIANYKMDDVLTDKYGIRIGFTDWFIFLLVAAARRKAEGLDYSNAIETLNFAFLLRVDFEKREGVFYNQNKKYISKDEAIEYGQHHFLKKYFNSIPEVNEGEMIIAKICYEITFESAICTDHSAYYAAEVLIKESENEINEMIKRGFLQVDMRKK